MPATLVTTGVAGCGADRDLDGRLVRYAFAIANLLHQFFRLAFPNEALGLIDLLLLLVVANLDDDVSLHGHAFVHRAIDLLHLLDHVARRFAAAAIAIAFVTVPEQPVAVMAAAVVATAVAATARHLARSGNLLAHDYLALDLLGYALILGNRSLFFLPHRHAYRGRVLADLFVRHH